MKIKALYKNDFPSALKLIIYLIIISALCFLACLVSGAREKPSPSEEISWTLPLE